jgi:hypothetical protein
MPTPTPNNSGGAFTTVRPGDKLRISAREKNAWNEVAKAAGLSQFDSSDRRRGGAGDDGVSLLVKNTTGGDLNQFSIVGIDGILFSPSDNLDGFKNGPVLTGVTPADPDHVHKFAVLLAPAKDDTLALAKLAGPCVVKVDVSDVDHPFATISDGDATKLVSHSTQGVPILYKESGTGTKWAVVLLGGGGGDSEAAPTAENQVEISKPDPDNPGEFISEWNYLRPGPPTDP